MLSLFIAALAATAAGASTTSQAADDSQQVCKFVLAADPAALPYKLCQSKAQWSALEAQYAKDANRMVCHYEDLSGDQAGRTQDLRAAIGVGSSATGSSRADREDPDEHARSTLTSEQLDAPRGFEPRLTDSESVVLPLDDGAMPGFGERAR